MIYTGVFEEAQRRELSHHGVKGMHWGVRNAETQAKHAGGAKPKKRLGFADRYEIKSTHLTKAEKKHLKSKEAKATDAFEKRHKIGMYQYLRENDDWTPREVLGKAGEKEYHKLLKADYKAEDLLLKKARKDAKAEIKAKNKKLKADYKAYAKAEKARRKTA